MSGRELRSLPFTTRWDARIRPSLPRGLEAALSLAILIGLGRIDYLSGPHFDLTVFYFLPICMASWSSGLWLGLPVALMSLIATHFADVQLTKLVPIFTPRYVLYQDVVHALMFLPAASMTWLIKRQGDRLAAEHRETLEAQAQLQADLDAANRVQRSLMGQALPEVPTLAMKMRYRSARQVGGDLIEVRRRGVRLGICVADVSGKGAQAALMAVAVKGWLDYVPGRFVSPAEVADHLNRRLSECVPVEMFVTFAYFVINTTTGEVRYAVAGHDPPLLRRANGKIEELGPTGPALGLIPDAAFGEGTLTLEHGDLLLLYTDGLTTAETDHGRTGLEPTLELLKQAPPIDELVDRLMRTAVPAGGEPGDDVALLAVMRREGGA